MGRKSMRCLLQLLLFFLFSSSSCAGLILFELPRDAYFKEVSTKLDPPPQKIEFPDSLKDKIHYDANKGLLSFKGIMSEGEKEALLSKNPNYTNAIERLFHESREEILAKSKEARPVGIIKLFTQLLKRPKAQIGSSKEKPDRLVRRDLQDFISEGKEEASDYLNNKIKLGELLEGKLEEFKLESDIPAVVPNPGIIPGPKLTFVHISDVHVHDERVYMFDKELTDFLDKFKQSFAFDPDMVLFDHAYYLAFIATTQIMCNRLEKKEKPKFMIHTGDAIDMGVVSELYEFLYITNHLRIPWYNVLGNHDYPVYGNIESQNVGVVRPNMGFQTINTRYNFINMHGKGFDADHLVYFSPDNAPHSETWLNDSVYNGFDMKGRPRWASERLEKLPRGLQFPDTLKDKISYDADKKLLIFNGSMTLEARNELLKLSEDTSYKEAVERLHQKSLEFREGNPCSDCPGYYHFEAVPPSDEGPGILCIVLDTTTAWLRAKGTLYRDSEVSEPADKKERQYLEINWLRNILEDYTSRKEKWMVLVFGHHPLRGEDFFDNSWQEVEKLLLEPKYNVIAYLCGHTHEHGVRYHPNNKYPGIFGFWEAITDSIMEYPKRGSLVTIRYEENGEWKITLQSFWPYILEKLDDKAPQFLQEAKLCFDASKEDAEGKKKEERFRHLERKHYDAVLKFVFPKI